MEPLYVVDTPTSGDAVIREATREEIRFGDAMPYEQAVYWAGVFVEGTTGRVRDMSRRAKKNPRRNPRRNPDAVTLRVPGSVHDEIEHIAVDTFHDDVDLASFYSPERIAFVQAARNAKRKGSAYVYTLDARALAYLPLVIEDALDFAQGRLSDDQYPRERARDRRLVKSLEAVLAEARAGGTKPKVRPATAKPATPSLDTLMDVLDIMPERAKRLKAMMGGFASVDDVLNVANGYMSGYGVAYAPSTQDAAKGRNGLSYVNMGNTYSATLVYDHDKGRYLVSSWGDIVEADGRLPKTRRRFA